MSGERYAIKYLFNIDTNNNHGFSKEEIITAHENVGDVGGTDAIIFISILREKIGAHKGASSFMTMTFDGHNEGKPIPSSELFSAWVMLATTLVDADIPSWSKEIAGTVIESTRKIIKQHKEHKND